MDRKYTLNEYPNHVAFIMDGNRRWAKKHNFPIIEGHKKGSEVIKKIIKSSINLNIKYLTFFSFSTENWKRNPNEINELKGLLNKYLDSEVDNFISNQIKFNVIGNLSKFENNIKEKIIKLEEKTKGFKKLVFTLALSYGSRNEIVEAVEKIKIQNKKKINEKLFNNHLMTKDLPDPDFVIRTSGEMRLSNFLLWQIAYSELYFTKTLWPDFNIRNLNRALHNYIRRKRKLGK